MGQAPELRAAIQAKIAGQPDDLDLVGPVGRAIARVVFDLLGYDMVIAELRAAARGALGLAGPIDGTAILDLVHKHIRFMAEGDAIHILGHDQLANAIAARAITGKPSAGALTDGERCRFTDCRPGLFRWADTLCFKSEYSSKVGQADAYCVGSGEYFWGGTNGDLAARRDLIVTPVEVQP